LEKAMALSPRKAGCYEALVMCSRITAEDHHFAAMRKLAANPASLSETEQIDLHYALGKAFADVGEHQQSFDHILAANALKRRQIKFDEGSPLSNLSGFGMSSPANCFATKRDWAIHLTCRYSYSACHGPVRR
jgi:hypothetical protein